MDSSKLCGEAEECQSSESGWTTYIGSPIHGDDDDDDDGDSNDDYEDYADGGDGKDDHSDDSMASDASSGPSLQGSLYGDVKDHGHVNSHFKHDRVLVGKSYHFQKKTTEKPFMEKQKDGLGMRKKEEREERNFKSKRSSHAATSQSGTKSLWLGRRK